VARSSNSLIHPQQCATDFSGSQAIQTLNGGSLRISFVMFPSRKHHDSNVSWGFNKGVPSDGTLIELGALWLNGLSF
jgi:hypothetical protein